MKNERAPHTQFMEFVVHKRPSHMQVIWARIQCKIACCACNTAWSQWILFLCFSVSIRLTNEKENFSERKKIKSERQQFYVHSRTVAEAKAARYEQMLLRSKIKCYFLVQLFTQFLSIKLVEWKKMKMWRVNMRISGHLNWKQENFLNDKHLSTRCQSTMKTNNEHFVEWHTIFSLSDCYIEITTTTIGQISYFHWNYERKMLMFCCRLHLGWSPMAINLC